MLKQCASQAEADSEEPSPRAGNAFLDDKKQDDVLEVQDPADATPVASQTVAANMTTATSPPPPPPDTEQAQHRATEDADDPASARMEDGDDQPESTSTMTSATELGARLACAVCDAVLATEASLAAHIQDLGLNHTGGGDEVQGYGCRVCRRVFDNADVLDRHVLSHPGEQVFKCPLCGQALRTNGGLARHARRHLDGHASLLRQESLASLRSTSVKRCLETGHTDDRDYEVEAKRRSPSHIADEDPAASPASAPAPAVPSFTCPVCPASNPFRAPYLPELETHLEQNHRDYSVSCDLCGGTYRSVRDLNLHVHAAHRSGGKASRGRDVVGFRDLTFVDFSSQKFAHIARAECEKSLHRAASRQHPFQCECGLAFPCDSALVIHRRECPNTVYLDSPADLSRGPVGRREPSLTLDGASTKGDFFAKLDLLNASTSAAVAAAALSGRLQPVAMDRDLADIPSILNVSAASGVVMGHGLGGLQDHEERDDHEEQQDAFAAEFRRMKQRGEFPCRLCPEVFPNLRALKGHNRAHMAAPGADGYRCNMCPHAALDKVALQRHMRTHNGARPYECALCRFAFTTKANCERHLRNRHAKCSRDEVKSSIIYHPSEDPGNDPELQQQLQQQHAKLDVKRSLFAEPMLDADDHLHRHSLDVGTMTSASEDDDMVDRDDQVEVADVADEDEGVAEDGRQSPLDLSMVLDLSKKPAREEADVEPENTVVADDDEEEVEDDDQPQDLSRKSTAESAAAPATPPLHRDNQSTPLQSPEPGMPFPGLGSLYANPYQLAAPAAAQGLPAGLSQSLPQGLPQGLAQGLPFPAAYYPSLLRSLQFSQLGGGLVFEPMRLLQRPPFLPTVGAPTAAGEPSLPLPAVPLPVAVPLGVPMSAAELSGKDDAAALTSPSACPLAASPKSERSMSSVSEAPPQPQQPSSASSSVSSSSSSKMVMKNGVLMPKQKQRRYRTERPHVCEHCSARFTLSSNRERHVKHQHPEIWSQRHRGAGPTAPASPPPTPGPAPMDASTPLRVPSVDASSTPCSLKHADEDDEDEGLVIDEERPSSEDHHDEGIEGDAEDDVHAVPAPTTPAAGEDLASVSRLLNNTSIQFRQFLREGEDQAAAASTPSREAAPAPEEGLGSEEDMDEEGLVAGSPSDGNNSGSEQDKSESESATAPMKKKSAYSMAPNRVSCPYCARKFPWTSSLRRHVLTHTGQKPYKCTFCPLLFTTKSNCDRHLARKHSNKKDANNSSSCSSSSGVSTAGTPNSSAASVSPGSSAGSGGGSPPEAAALCRSAAALSPPAVPLPLPLPLPLHGMQPLGLSLPQPLPLAMSHGFPLRNVPERPYRCRFCPSSTFASLSNLRKHVATKHTGASLESCILPGDSLSSSASLSGYESHGSASDAEHEKAEEADKHDVKVPLYSPGLDLQPLSLCKVERADADVKPEPRREASGREEVAVGSRRASAADAADRDDIMREAHNTLMSAAAAAPISAPVVSIPEGTPRPVESSLTLPSSELPFKCHLCDGSFTDRHECLDHIKLNHESEFGVLQTKGALELSVAASPEDNNNAMDENHHADGENIEHIRGKFPDYANRKVMCAFCMRRFWSAEDLRRHMRTHTGERPFSCDVCRRRFTLKHSMLRHRKKHNDISNNNNNSLSTPVVNSVSLNASLVNPAGPEDLPEDLSPSATSGDEEGFPASPKNRHSTNELIMKNHNNNNINITGVKCQMLKARCDNHVNFSKLNFRRKEEEDSSLIGNLLGIGDPSLIDKVLLTKSAHDAEKLLGVFKNGSKCTNGRT